MCLTDHRSHSKENSVYGLLKMILADDRCRSLHIASRGTAENAAFFYRFSSQKLFVKKVDSDFSYDPSGKIWEENMFLSFSHNYDIILLRLPRPIPMGFFSFLRRNFPEHAIVNRPSGIEETGNKAFLTRVRSLCPPIKICKSIEDIEVFKKRFPIVLKPFDGYGGKGILKIVDELVFEGERPPYSFEQFRSAYLEHHIPYLAMKYLRNVDQGDKRIIVAGDRILGASLRIPPKDSWMCNVSMGGISHFSELTEEEEFIANKLIEKLKPKGIVLFGFDTLVDDNGKRKLSEINSLSVGGMIQAQRLSGKPVLKWASDAIWDYIIENNS